MVEILTSNMGPLIEIGPMKKVMAMANASLGGKLTTRGIIAILITKASEVRVFFS